MLVFANKSCGSASGLRYSLRQSSTTPIFSIDEQRGKICVLSSLDFETTSKYQLTVLAHQQSGQVGYSLVNIHIEDVNDNSPYFLPVEYSVSVRDDIAAGSPVLMLSAKDADQGAYGQISFRIASGAHDDFYIDSRSGHLYVKKPLSQKNYDILVQAKDGGGLVSDEKGRVHVTVIKPETPVPQFTLTFYKFIVSEDVLPGIAIGNIEATGPFPIKYSIYSGDPHHLFSIEPSSGRILVARMLDGDICRTVLLNVQARMDGGGTNHSQVLVEMTDVNDNDPIFSMDRVEVNVLENFEAHIPFFAVQATDADFGKNGQIAYSILSSQPPCPVSVRPLTGELTLTTSLDYETIRNYQLVVRAKDHGIPPRSSNTTVVINVVDVNDNPPVFETQHFQIKVPENIGIMSEILTVKASDADSGENGRIRYFLVGQNDDFGVHSSSGHIFVKNPLDRERISTYHYVVTAMDNGQPQLASNLTLDIVVLDVNDNSPRCINSSTLIFNDDTALGEVFGIVLAADPDNGRNGTVTFRLQNADANFAVNSKGEVSLKRKFSSVESVKDYRLSIIASDGGLEARSTVCQIKAAFEHVQSKVAFQEPINRYIRLPDDCLKKCELVALNASNVYKWEIEPNEVSSFFRIALNTLWTTNNFDASYFEKNRRLTISAYDSQNRKRSLTLFIRPMLSALKNKKGTTTFIKLHSSTPTGSKIATIGREERDVFWTLENDTNDFVLHEASSALYLASNLLDNSEMSYALSIMRTIAPEYISEKYIVYVEVVSENLHNPEFENCPMTLTVPEDTIVGSQIGQVTAVDFDESPDGDVTYRILRNETTFSVDAVTGELFLNRPLNWSIASKLFFVVEAEDRALDLRKKRRSQCAIFVIITDTNNNPPFFLSKSKISVDDDGCVSGLIHHVVAKDVDEGDNGRVTYSVVDLSTDISFSIDEDTGALSVDECLTETSILRIHAMDHGVTSNIVEQNLTIVVAPNQNFWKFFDSKYYRFLLSEDSKIGTLVYEFVSRAHGLKEMKLFSNFVTYVNVFDLSSSGKLKVASEMKESFYDFIVIALNYGNQSDWTNVHIEVAKTGNALPNIASTSCGNLTVRENIAVHNLARIFTITNNSNEMVEYKIVAGNEKNFFSIDRTTGVISCVSLDREYKSEHFLVIVAERKNVLTQADTCTLRIKVDDENDNTPNITGIVPEYVQIDDSTAVGSVVAIVNVEDEDEGDNAEVFYSLIEDESGMFDIDSEKGEIIFARDLIRTKSEITLKIRAENKGFSLPLFADSVVRVSIRRKKPENLYEPAFLSNRYVGHVFEGVPRGEVVLKISSTDRILGDAPLTYSILSGNVDNVFEIDENGFILTTQELDREIEKEYTLKIVGHGIYKVSPETSVFIRVLNVNDNAPLIKKMRGQRISESAPIGTMVAKVIATDVDVNSHVEFSLTPNHFFDINRFSGIIHLKRKLDFETSTRHELEIQAFDGEHSSAGKLVVDVVDENDNAPIFEKKFYDIIAERNLPVGSIISVVNAKDLDNGLNGNIFYNFSKESSVFQIDSNNGTIRSLITLSSSATYYLKVQAFDYGSPVLSSAVTVRIRIMNNAVSLKPRFEKLFYNFSIPENFPTFVAFGRVEATSTTDVMVEYRIIDIESALVFEIGRDGGLVLKKSVDRELQAYYKFSVEASSKYSSSVSLATVEIHLIDVNDNDPCFSPHSGKVLISEYMRSNDVLTRFVATDQDAGSNGEVTYELISGNDFDMFRLDNNTGLLHFVSWSEEALRQRKRFSDLVIVAKDNGEISRWNATVVSILFDVDSWSGSAPFFVVPFYQKSVFENLSAGEVILKSKAVSRIGIHGKEWEYALKDNDEAFVCNRTNGEISIREQLDYETRTSYEFSLIVRDRSSRSAVVPVQIRVLGVDEHPPSFVKKSFTFRIPITARAGERVGVVAANDRDSGLDGVVRYEFEGNFSNYLSIDSETGQVFLRQDLTMLNRTIDEFSVIALSGILQSKAKIFIEIGDFSTTSSDATNGFLSGTRLVAIISSFLLVTLLIVLSFLVLKMRSRIKRQKRPQKQVYSVTRGNVAVMADIYRNSPKFIAEKQRVPLPTPPTARLQTSLSMQESGCSYDSAHIRTKSANEQLRNLENVIIGRSMPRSMPDSGIEPDDVSVTSSVTDYLTQIGVTHNQIFDRNVEENLNRLPPRMNGANYDPELNELIYAKVDEILSPASRINSSLTSVSLTVPSLNQSPFKVNPMPSFQPYINVFSQADLNS